MEQEDEKVTLRIPKRYLDMIDYLVEVDDFPTRSEAIRSAIRDMVYHRIELVQDKLARMQRAEQAIAQAEKLKKEYMGR
ncbi:MAG: ribbon-helix-helix protein, CopG family [Euryarchaeota archaeon]|nr:ribbon-helix-helix protein, CopG family [Euryarchaeota archaeon]